MHSNDKFFVSRGAKPIEVEGIQKSVCARIMSLALGGQTLLSSRAGQIAMSSNNNLFMRDIGKWLFKGVKKPMQLYSISWQKERLVRPKGNSKVKLMVKPKLTKEEVVKKRLKIIFGPLVVFLVLWFTLIVFSILEFTNSVNFPARMILNWISTFDLFELISSIKESLRKLFKYL